MPTRRAFLTTALVLPTALMQAASAQTPTPAKTKPATEIFADFESGNWDGWTLEGTAFGNAPATDALFPGRITGFGGQGFASTFHPRLGSAATGKATSRVFTLEKSFITFKIGGGYFPGQACLNLVVDGKVVRTDTGDGTPTLSNASWDVFALKGKQAHLEIVDTTTANNRGYILVDDIHFTDTAPPTGYGWRDNSIQPFFITRAKLWQGVDFRKGYSPFPFKLSEQEVQRAIDRVVATMHDSDMALPPVSERSIARIGEQIVRKVDATIAALKLQKVNKFTREWLIAEGVCEWVRINLRYDDDLAKVEGQDDYRRMRATSKYILGLEQPTAVCWGIAVTVRDLARAAGLKCDFVNGTTRGLGNVVSNPTMAQKERNHGVACFVFDGGIQVPSDVSSAISEYQNNKRKLPGRKTVSYNVLPRHTEAWELFLATFSADIGEEMTISDDKQNRHKLLDLSFFEWATRDTKYLNVLLQEYRSWEATR